MPALVRRHAVIAVVTAVVIVLPVIWTLPDWPGLVSSDPSLTAKERADLENDARRTIIQVVGGLLLVGTLYFTWRRVGAAEKTVQLSEQGQITERFTRAIEQLGSEKLAVRLGGIYALERIARDSERDHWPIMEVLTAFVRENARWRDPPPSEEAAEPPRPPADIQAILTALGRRERSKEREGDRRLDLNKTDLRAAALRDAHLEGAILVEAHLEGADLWRTHLEGAHLWRTHLEEADVDGAHLERAGLNGAHLEGAFFCEAYLKGANLNGAHLEGADLNNANLEGALLRGATGLTREQIDEAITDETTKLPSYLTASEAATD